MLIQTNNSNDATINLGMSLYGGLEAGGTKFSCIIGSDPDHILSECTIPTTTPEETLRRVIDFFNTAKERTSIESIGIGSFGPIDLDRASRFFGYITNTPKPGWKNTDLIGTIGRGLKIPIVFDTDTDVAALGETTWGAAQGVDDLLYVTIGTGIGGGIIVHGKPLHGLLHPEIGHMRIPHDWKQDPFPGVCPYHGDCLEGLASGPSIHKRWGTLGESLPAHHQAWTLERQYVATGVLNLISVVSPKLIILGGGVMTRTELFDGIRSKIKELSNGYFDHIQLQDRIAEYVIPPRLGKRSGVLGALALAQRAFAS
jgi:fructokinase